MNVTIKSFLFLVLTLITVFNGCKKLDLANRNYKVAVIMPNDGYEQVIEGLQASINNSKFKDKIDLIIQKFPTNKEEFDSATEIVKSLDPDLVYTVTTPATISAYKNIPNKPIIFVAVGDPIGVGLAESFKKPKKNITGITNFSRELTKKRLEYFKLAFPSLKKIITFYNPENSYSVLAIKDLEDISEKLNIKVDKISVNDKDIITKKLKDVKWKNYDGIFIIPEPVVFSVFDEIIRISDKYNIPVCVHEKKWVKKGAIISYGVDLKDVGKLSYPMVLHVLNGGRPEDLPIFVPEKVDLVINNRLAIERNYKIPPEILYFANEVIQ